jgi:hypothetical protein
MEPTNVQVNTNRPASRAIQENAGQKGMQLPAVDPLQQLEQVPAQEADAPVIQRKYAYTGQENIPPTGLVSVWQNKNGEKFKLNSVTGAPPNISAEFESVGGAAVKETYQVPAEVKGLPYNAFQPDRFIYKDPAQPGTEAVVQDLTGFSALSILPDIKAADWNSHFHKTAFLTRVSLMPVDQAGTDNLFKANQLWVTEVKMSDDRPPTKFGKEGQRSHTVAWTLLRAAMENMHNQSLENFIETVSHLFVESRVAEKSKAEARKAGEALAASIQAGINKLRSGQEAEVFYWQTQASSLLTNFVHYYQVSKAATYADGAAIGHGEPGHMETLRWSEKQFDTKAALAGDELTNATTAAIGMFDAKKTLKEKTIGRVLGHWLNNLHLAFPRLMRAHHADMLAAFTGKLGLKGPDLDNIKMLLGGDPTIAHANITAKATAPAYTHAAAPVNMSLGPNQSTFVADVAVVPVNKGAQAAMDINVTGGAPKTLTLDAYKPDDLTIAQLKVADDRPPTRFGALQRSHTVAWTLVRRHLISFGGQPVSKLLTFMHNEMGVLKKDIGKPGRYIKFDAAGSATALEAGLKHLIDNKPLQPLHQWQAALSQLVETYITLYQLSNSATYSKEERPTGHAEAEAIKKLDTASHAVVADPANKAAILNSQLDLLGEQAAKLVDTVIATSSLKPDNWLIAIQHWIHLLEGRFPHLMSHGPFKDKLIKSLSVAEPTEETIAPYGAPANFSTKEKLLINLYESAQNEVKNIVDIFVSDIKSSIRLKLAMYAAPEPKEWSSLHTQVLIPAKRLNKWRGSAQALARPPEKRRRTGTSSSARSIPDKDAIQHLTDQANGLMGDIKKTKDDIGQEIFDNLETVKVKDAGNKAFWASNAIKLNSDIKQAVEDTFTLSKLGSIQNYSRWYEVINAIPAGKEPKYKHIKKAIEDTRKA